MIVYRVMKRTLEGRPEHGTSMLALGVRVRDIHPRIDGSVDPKTGGVSASPTLEGLPRAAQVSAEPTFQLETEDLPEGLIYRTDPYQPNTHGFIEPAGAMRFEHYHRLIRETSELWSLV